MNQFKAVVTVVFSSLLLVTSCAKRGRPSGGEGDITPPLFLSVSPETESVSIPTNATIQLRFNEWIEPRSVASAITVHPTVPGGFSTKVSTRNVVISANDSFADNTTYHVSINTELSDFYRNTIIEPISLVFSTGETIDSGLITGVAILENDSIQTPLKVALFRADRFDTTLDTTYFSEPDYLTQCDSLGVFNFSNINENSYRIVGFRDENGDNLLSTNEKGFIYHSSVVSTDEKDTIVLTRVSVDTILSSITSPIFLNSSILQATISPQGSASLPDSLYLSYRDSIDTALYTPTAIQLLSDSSTVVVRFDDDSIPSQQYELITVRKNRISAGENLPEPDSTDTLPPYHSLVADTLIFNAVTFQDTTVPELLRGRVIDPKTRAPKFELQWSIPVAPIDKQAVTLIDSNGTTYEIEVSRHSDITTSIVSKDEIKPGTPLILTARPSKFQSFTKVAGVDRIDTIIVEDTFAGNDSTDTAVVFDTVEVLRDTVLEITTPENRDIALSVLLVYPNGEQFKGWQWELTSSEIPATIPLKSTAEGYIAKDVPAGKYGISLFDDRNGNGIQDEGTLFPHRVGESRIYLPDSRLFPHRVGESRIYLPDSIKAKGHWRTETVFETEVTLNRQPAPVIDSLSDTTAIEEE